MSQRNSLTPATQHHVPTPTQTLKRYEGKRLHGQAIVTVNGQPLNPRFDLRNHSPNGFEWGYGGSGPAQLALAILANCLRDDEQALTLYQGFKWKVIASLPHEGWTLTGDQIRDALQAIEKERHETD